MKLNYLYETNLAKRVVTTSGIITIIAILGASIVLLFSITRMSEVSTRTFVKEPGGAIYSATLLNYGDLEQKKNDYYVHCENGIKLMFDLDEGDLETEKINYGLIHFGECGKQILKKFNDMGITSLLQSYNLRTKVENLNITFTDSISEPFQGKITFDWEFIQQNNVDVYEVSSDFYIYDVQAWSKNKLGAKIENFIPVLYKK